MLMREIKQTMRENTKKASLHLFFFPADTIDRVSERVEELCKSIKQIKEDNEMEGREQIYSSKPLSNTLSR